MLLVSFSIAVCNLNGSNNSIVEFPALKFVWSNRVNFFFRFFLFIYSAQIKICSFKAWFLKKKNIFLSFSFGSEHQRRVKRKNVARFSIVRLLIEHFLFGRFVYKQIILINNEKRIVWYAIQPQLLPAEHLSSRTHFFPIHFVFLLHEFILETFRSIKF